MPKRHAHTAALAGVITDLPLADKKGDSDTTLLSLLAMLHIYAAEPQVPCNQAAFSPQESYTGGFIHLEIEV